MKIFNVSINPKNASLIVKYGTKNILTSNHYMNDHNITYFKSLKISPENKDASVFLDSGAFTAFQKKSTINIQKYIIDLFRIHKYFDIIASLDVIGDPEASYNNYLKLRGYEFSDKIVPVWHSNATLDYLKKYLSMTRYIAIGKLVSLKYLQRMFVISKVLSHIRKLGYTFYSDYDPDTHAEGIKVHLFGVTDINIMQKFPQIYSTDSSTWLSGQKFAELHSGTGLTNRRFTYPKRIKSHYDLSSVNNLLLDRKIQAYLSEYQHKIYLTKTLK